ncbi:MAG: hypothetical protein K2J74_07955 [Muribaculaceae bacterium]|nr:hypothetical protein [Muribaculaceae bacterium]
METSKEKWLNILRVVISITIIYTFGFLSAVWSFDIDSSAIIGSLWKAYFVGLITLILISNAFTWAVVLIAKSLKKNGKQ